MCREFRTDRSLTGSVFRSQLQAVLRWSVVSILPAEIPLSEAEGTTSDEAAVTVVINVKQVAAKDPPRPLTICTAHTVLGWGDPSIRLLMQARGEHKYLLGDPLPGVHMRYAEPKSDDWKDELPFITIPPGDEGFTATRTISWERLFQHPSGNPVSQEQRPRAGDEYELCLTGGRKETFTDWWGWGDLEGNLKDRKLVDLVNPKLNGVEDPKPPPPHIVLPYGAWDEDYDDNGNQFVHLLIHLDTTPVILKFVE